MTMGKKGKVFWTTTEEALLWKVLFDQRPQKTLEVEEDAYKNLFRNN